MRATFVMTAGIMVVTLGLASEAAADSHACTTVDRGAKALVSSSSSVTIAEENRNCTISVNGATSMGTQSQAWSNAANLVISAAREGQPLPFDDELAYGLFVAPVTEGTEGAPGSFSISEAEKAMLSSCFTEFIGSVRSNPQLNFATDALPEPVERMYEDRFSCATTDAGEIAPLDDRLISSGSTGLSAVVHDGSFISQVFFPASLLAFAVRAPDFRF